MTRAVIYTRFSSDQQSETSTQAQIRACKAYAEKKGMTVCKIYSDEAISGTEASTKKQAQYQQMLADAKERQFDVVLIHKYDRVARSLIEHVELAELLKNNDIKIYAVAQDYGEGLEGELIMQMMWILSEYYSQSLAKEVQKGHEERTLKDQYNGGQPSFGYDVVNAAGGAK